MALREKWRTNVRFLSCRCPNRGHFVVYLYGLFTIQHNKIGGKDVNSLRRHFVRLPLWKRTLLPCLTAKRRFSILLGGSIQTYGQSDAVFQKAWGAQNRQ